ncbi:endochitinase A-like [Phalaenopsis equestris]|uniref:endochitinase A-like n=1 Tax=Phalaenopsis equestris TaxID=78828 RepID=UPI0009E29EA0|nr:endochitinase A-like [Phalaenopsis equestris]XP_020577145.1 endochitinase A-like [Phalaenopsis equestris]
MERNFRAPEPRGIVGRVVKDREEELTLFTEMRKREKEKINLLLQKSDELDPSMESVPGGSPIFKMLQSTVRRTTVDEFLNSDCEKSDYDWLLTPPGTPLFPCLQESHRSPVGYNDTPKGYPTLINSRLANPADHSSKTIAPSRQMAPSVSLNSSFSGMGRPSSSVGSASRPATLNGRPTVGKIPRSSTPTSRSTLPSKSVVSQPRPSTPGRSSTLTRSSIPSANKPASRSDTPIRRSSIPSSLHASSAPVNRSSSIIKLGTATSSMTSGPATSSIGRLGPTNSIARSVLPASSILKSGPNSSKTVAPSRGNSPTVRPAPWKPSEMPGFSFDAPPNLRTTMPERSSPSRGRPGAPSSRSPSVDNGPIARPRRQSSSPCRGRVPKGNAVSGSSVPASSRYRMNGCDNESPVVIGTKMVERVVNSRRLAPPKHDEPHSSGKSSLSPDSTGFGRTLSKKSLDMAMRHMDIRRSIPNTLRPLMSNVPASSLYSVRSGLTISRTVSVSDSPIATSSNASSEQSVNNNVFCHDGNEIQNEIFSEKCERTSPSFFLAR